VPDDRLAAATAELYGAAPDAFTERRGELAAAAREAGDRAAAKAIGALRRPTRAAWVVNRLARADPGAPPKLAELAAALRAAQEARHGPRLRELSAARGALVDALTAQALAAADVAEPPPSLRLEVSQTLEAALADPGVAADFAAGTLTRAMQWSGFGLLPAGPEAGEASGAGEATGVTGAAEDSGAGEGARPTDAAARAPGIAERAVPAARSTRRTATADRDDAAAPGTVRPGPGRARAPERDDKTGVGGRAEDGGGRTRGGAGAGRRSGTAAAAETAQATGQRHGAGTGAADTVRGKRAGADAARHGAGTGAADTVRGKRAGADAARRQAEADERLAQDAAERAARRREQYEESERLAAAASTAAAEAVAAEDGLEAEVRDLEQRLTRARSDLAAARMRARHAEAAERRARQALDRQSS
jgi:hypothetical protein